MVPERFDHLSHRALRGYARLLKIPVHVSAPQAAVRRFTWRTTFSSGAPVSCLVKPRCVWTSLGLARVRSIRGRLPYNPSGDRIGVIMMNRLRVPSAQGTGPSFLAGQCVLARHPFRRPGPRHSSPTPALRRCHRSRMRLACGDREKTAHHYGDVRNTMVFA